MHSHGCAHALSQAALCSQDVAEKAGPKLPFARQDSLAELAETRRLPRHGAPEPRLAAANSSAAPPPASSAAQRGDDQVDRLLDAMETWRGPSLFLSPCFLARTRRRLTALDVRLMKDATRRAERRPGLVLALRVHVPSVALAVAGGPTPAGRPSAAEARFQATLHVVDAALALEDGHTDFRSGSAMPPAQPLPVCGQLSALTGTCASVLAPGRALLMFLSRVLSKGDRFPGSCACFDRVFSVKGSVAPHGRLCSSGRHQAPRGDCTRCERGSTVIRPPPAPCAPGSAPQGPDPGSAAGLQVCCWRHGGRRGAGSWAGSAHAAARTDVRRRAASRVGADAPACVQRVASGRVAAHPQRPPGPLLRGPSAAVGRGAAVRTRSPRWGAAFLCPLVHFSRKVLLPSPSVRTLSFRRGSFGYMKLRSAGFASLGACKEQQPQSRRFGNHT
jgi:hypothetical protein